MSDPRPSSEPQAADAERQADAAPAGQERTSLFRPVQAGQPGPSGPPSNQNTSQGQGQNPNHPPTAAESDQGRTSLFQPVQPPSSDAPPQPNQGPSQGPSQGPNPNQRPGASDSGQERTSLFQPVTQQPTEQPPSDQQTVALSGSLTGSLSGPGTPPAGQPSSGHPRDDHQQPPNPQAGPAPHSGSLSGSLTGSYSGSLGPTEEKPAAPAEPAPERTTTFSPIRDAETTRFEGSAVSSGRSPGLEGRLGEQQATHVVSGSLLPTDGPPVAGATEVMASGDRPQGPNQALQGALPQPGEPQTVVIPKVNYGGPPPQPEQAGLTALFDGSAAAEQARQEAVGGEQEAESGHGPMSDAEYARRLSKVKRGGLVAAAVVGVLGLLYGADLMLSSNHIPRGVEVAGVSIGGMERSEAEERLRAEIGPRLGTPVAVQAGDVETEIDPESAGLTLDWDRTLTQVQDQPLNPFVRLSSFFTSREVDVVTATDRDQLTAAVEALSPEINREPAEGSIAFEGTTPVAIEPMSGQNLDIDGSVDVLYSGWADGRQLELPVSEVEVATTSEGVQRAITEIAEPAVASPVTITGDGKDALLEPAVIASALTFVPGENGGLSPELDLGKVTESLQPQLADTEEEGKDAEILFDGGSPRIEPSVDGRGINWETTLEPLQDVLRAAVPQERTIPAEYEDQPAEITTEQAEELGIKEQISSFTTGGFAADSGINIRQAAAEVNGAIVPPGETFTLNTHTGPRGLAEGYVEAGIIQDGAPGRAVGGGISQFATTLYNAYYFAGLQDNGHQEHSYYISRYPEGREATVFQNPDGSSVIDVGFVNDSDTGVVIQTNWTPSEVTVTIWGTKRYEVESVTGDRTNLTEPQTKEIPEGEPCSPSNGGQGFTVTDTRIIRDLNGNEVRRDGPRAVTYNPQPKIVCGSEGGEDGDR
ncbi:VanW family protein [Actinoalloteichus hymeniacidonis]|uniref:YoaR-like putative peptidoglycan binding domain-containing protein n=1 Tax=Actinoalloteichus hymeniacidonis TaxID=340345 RepID=A0AAC9HW14_9PSEU|nr:VanW family protein [Actinoalloteichus hymeniacidonis]AOS66051.1 hypothetical protein TL08_26410 [Actinoalloteichus hymeniacidonis]MBB5905846.1 vancomycin resistance protein YoaR [Actinoalloteichus hymeniacidonis]